MPHSSMPQILLFAQVNLDQSDEVTSNHEYKFMNKCRKSGTRASLIVSCTMQKEGIQYNPSECSTSCEGVTTWEPFLSRHCLTALHLMSEQDTVDLPQTHCHGKSSITTLYDCYDRKSLLPSIALFFFSCQFFGKENGVL